jgi:hypothetical protein
MALGRHRLGHSLPRLMGFLTFLVNCLLFLPEFVPHLINRLRQMICKSAELSPEPFSHFLMGRLAIIEEPVGIELMVLDIDNILSEEVHPRIKRPEELFPEVCELFCKSHSIHLLFSSI